MNEKAEILRKQRRERFEKTLNYEIPDKLPVFLMGHVAPAKYADPNIVVADAIRKPEYFIDKAYEGLEMLKDVDAVQGFLNPINRLLGLAWMSRTKLPGIELEEDDMIQIIEDGKMTYDDYDVILNKGWIYFQNKYMEDVMDIHLGDKSFQFSDRFRAYSTQKLDEYGYLNWDGGGCPLIFDWLTSMRGIAPFFRDMKKEPEKIKAVLDVMFEDTIEDFKKSCNKLSTRDFAVMVNPGVRGNCDFVARAVYEKFVWPYTIGYADAVIEADIPVFFHYDARWDSFLDFFTYFPKGKCIFDTDGMTDIYKVKEILGGRMAITANTPSALLTLGTPDEVYNYVKKQINEIGPNGFIVTSSCSTPSNAKPENLKALVDACR
ncbi:MAG: uroporphyrinogen decarboxylase family protein [Eubacteriales bacterium]